jgi:hypothetical protein
MTVGDRRSCKVCGTQVSASREICPVCMLRAAITEEASPEQSATLYFLGDFKTSRQYALRSLQIWRSGGTASSRRGQRACRQLSVFFLRSRAALQVPTRSSPYFAPKKFRLTSCEIGHAAKLFRLVRRRSAWPYSPDGRIQATWRPDSLNPARCRTGRSC